MDKATKAVAPARSPKTNSLGLEKNEYRGRPSTLCKGCGHDSISQRIINATWELGIDQTQVIKLSGIGCSSKTPTYFLGQSHGFNGVHGRMPSVATGAVIANRTLTAIGVSGDGDSVSIGIGQFKHVMRRNVPMTYIVENNGVYGLTKGQFSATADQGQVLRHAGVNDLAPLDVCLEALATNATFVARSFAEAMPNRSKRYSKPRSTIAASPCWTSSAPVSPSTTDSVDQELCLRQRAPDLLQELNFIPSYEEIEIDEYDDEAKSNCMTARGSSSSWMRTTTRPISWRPIAS